MLRGGLCTQYASQLMLVLARELYAGVTKFKGGECLKVCGTLEKGPLNSS